MTAQQLLSHLSWLGIELFANEDRLCYRAPKGVITKRLLSELSLRKSEILAALKAQRRRERPSRVPIMPIPKNGNTFLPSFAQQRLWVIDQLMPDSPVYNIAASARFSGPLNASLLERSLIEIGRRHESLRTTFITQNAQPFQVINQDSRLRLPIVDLSAVDSEDKEALVNEHSAILAKMPFDLSTGPLLRAALIRLAQDDHYLILSMHHIISDGWSMGIILKELASFYEALSKGEQASVEPLPIQYADFAQWQRSLLKDGVLDKQLPYWKKSLAGASLLLELPADQPRKAIRKFLGARREFKVEASVVELLKELSRNEGVTLFTTLLAAFNIILNKYSGQEDILVGTPVANRNRLEIEPLIGYFANTLVLRTDLSNTPTIRQLIKRAAKTAVAAFENQDVPFDKLVEELQPERGLSHNPLVQVMFVMQNSPATSTEFFDLSVKVSQIDTGTAKFDLSLILQETKDGLKGDWEYDVELFDPSTIARLSNHFCRLLNIIVSNPDLSLSDIDLLDPLERHEALVARNATETNLRDRRCVHHLFEQVASRIPDKTAIVFDTESHTYSELETLSNLLANYLRRRGVGPDKTVGIYMDRSIHMIISVLAVLKAGGAYVPLSIEQPLQRINDMIEDADIKIVLTSQSLKEALQDSAAELVAVENIWETALFEDHNPPSNNVSPNNLAYVIYTSGSTGEPKGIGLSHAALSNLIQWHLATMLNGTRTLQYSSLGFDASFHEIFATLCSGGTLFLIGDEKRKDVAELSRLMLRHRIEKVIFPAVVLQHFAEHNAGRGHLFSSLREIISTGEQLQITIPIRELFQDLENCSLHNHYGPSETHVVTAYTLEGNPCNWAALPSIGLPISKTQVYLLDKHMKPVPAGVSGEICIGGAALARGYYKTPDLTAERFVPNPYAKQPGDRLYKTGDLARFTNEGEIEFLGRQDRQVKIRGHRVEPGEIEARLLVHSQVREVVVMACGNLPGGKQLVAYIVPDPDQAPAVSDLVCFLKGRLPDFMVPQSFVFLECLPLTVNGKVDRRALPMPGRIRPEMTETYVAPRTPAEEVIAGIWQEVIEVERVGVFDNFFVLGGQSLLGTQVILRLREVFQVDIPLSTLFEAPTVDGLVKALAAIWEGRDVVDEIAWTHMRVEALSADDVRSLLTQHAVSVG